MSSRTRIASALGIAALIFTATGPAAAQRPTATQEPGAPLTTANVAGLYQMIDPRGYADPLAAATYLRLLPDGRSRLEGVIVTDAKGEITARTEIQSFNRHPWFVRPTPAGPELCFDAAGRTQCDQVEHDMATNDRPAIAAAKPSRPAAYPTVAQLCLSHAATATLEAH